MKMPHLFQLKLKHKEEGSKRRNLDIDDRNHIMVEFQKHAHPLTDPSPDLTNIVRKVADDTINVADAVIIGEKMKPDFTTLPAGSTAPLQEESRPWKR